jgi:hypothetical protein
MEIGFQLENIAGIQQLRDILPEAIEVGLGDLYQTMRLQLLDRTPVYVQRKQPQGPTKWPWHPAGYLKGKWQAHQEKLGFTISNDTWYLEILEQGKYPPPKTGGRTAYGPGGVFSKQTAKAPSNEPGPIMKPVAEDQESINKAMDLIVQELERRLK